jgi:hypothetical protein
MSSFDVRVFAIRRRPGRRVFEVRWRVAGRDKSRSFITRALADSYHAELVRAACRGQEFSAATGDPLARDKPPVPGEQRRGVTMNTSPHLHRGPIAIVPPVTAIIRRVTDRPT